MRAEDIQTGATYRIRQWEDMAAEFGESTVGDIMCDGSFVRGMRNLCGMRVTVLRTHYDEYMCVSVKYEDGNNHAWTITPDMLEYDYEDELPDVDPASIFVLLGG